MKEAELIYEDNPYLSYINPIFTDEDSFLSFMNAIETSELITLYNQILGLLKEHKSLYSLILRLKRIIVAGNIMTESLVLTEAMKKIVEETCEFLKCDRATVFLLDEQKQELWSKVGAGLSFTIRIPYNKGIVGLAVLNGEIVNIMDAYSDPRFNQEVDRKMGYKTETILVCPIFDQSKRVTGAVQAINKYGGYFTKEDEGLLAILANLAGSALRNSIQYDEQLLFLNNLRHILKQGISLNSYFTFNQMVPEAEEILKSTMNVEKAMIYIVNLEENLITHYEKTNEPKSFNIGCGIVGHVAQTKTIESLPNAYQHYLYNSTVDLETNLPIVCMPVKDKNDKLLGVFEVINPKGIQGLVTNQKSKISSMDFETLDFFAQQLAQGILNIYELQKILNTNDSNENKNESQ